MRGGHHYPSAVPPLVAATGVAPVYSGSFMALSFIIGLLTPSVGMALHTLARVSGLFFEQTTRACAPFFIPFFACLALVTHWNGLVMWLPTLIYR